IAQSDSSPVELEVLKVGRTCLDVLVVTEQVHEDIDVGSGLGDRHGTKWRGSAPSGAVVAGEVEENCVRLRRRDHDAYGYQCDSECSPNSNAHLTFPLLKLNSMRR